MTCAKWHTGLVTARPKREPPKVAASPVFAPPLLSFGTRAKRAYMDTTRVNKYGKQVPARDEVIVSQGLLTGREAEKLAVEVAEDTGHDHNEIRVEVYERGETPPMT